MRLHDWYVHNVVLRKAAPDAARLPDIVARWWEDHGQHVRSGDSEAIQARKCLTIIGDIAVADFDPPAQRKLLAVLAQDHKPAGVNRYWGTIKAALRWAVNEGLITSHPNLLANLKVGAQPKYVATVEQLARLWDAAEEPYTRAFLMVLMATLCRHEAAVQLRRLQCDLTAGTVDLNGEREQTDKRRPLILMPAVLRPWVAATTGFLVEKDGRPLKSCIIPFRRARERAGLPVEITPKVIRRSMATMMSERGVPQFQIEAYLGHHAVNSTATRHYIKPPRPDYLREACDSIDVLITEMGRLAGRPISTVNLDVRVTSVSGI